MLQSIMVFYTKLLVCVSIVDCADEGDVAFHAESVQRKTVAIQQEYFAPLGNGLSRHILPPLYQVF